MSQRLSWASQRIFLLERFHSMVLPATRGASPLSESSDAPLDRKGRILIDASLVESRANLTKSETVYHVPR